MAMMEVKSVLLICKEGVKTQKKKPCAQLHDECNIKQLLESFGYGVHCFGEIKDEYYKVMATENGYDWLRENFQLVVYNLKELDQDCARTVPAIILTGLPCAYVGDHNSMPTADVMSELSKYFPYEVPYFGCYASLVSLLDMLRRLEMYHVLKRTGREPRELARALMSVELSNLSEDTDE